LIDLFFLTGCDNGCDYFICQRVGRVAKLFQRITRDFVGVERGFQNKKVKK
jgi:hypothetical protein